MTCTLSDYCGGFMVGTVGPLPCQRGPPLPHPYVTRVCRVLSRSNSLYESSAPRCLPLASLHFHCVNIEIGLMSFCLWRGYTASPLFQSTFCPDLWKTDGIRIHIRIHIRTHIRASRSPTHSLNSLAGVNANLPRPERLNSGRGSSAVMGKVTTTFFSPSSACICRLTD